jgi:hypothetical protein
VGGSFIACLLCTKGVAEKELKGWEEDGALRANRRTPPQRQLGTDLLFFSVERDMENAVIGILPNGLITAFVQVAVGSKRGFTYRG